VAVLARAVQTEEFLECFLFSVFRDDSLSSFFVSQVDVCLRFSKEKGESGFPVSFYPSSNCFHVLTVSADLEAMASLRSKSIR
jgi:hypothetical protein